MYCKNCGKLLSADAKFCSECGTKVEVEAPKPKVIEPIFFTKEREETPAKPKKVVHLDEFNWDLEGYPTAPKKTEDVDFNWASVLEEKNRIFSPRPAPPKKEETETPNDTEVQEEPVVTVEELVEALPEEGAIDETEETVDETKENTVLESEIFDHLEQDMIEEPTKFIDKAQIKAGGVDQFYMFNQKRAELQELLDQEYARIQNGEMDEVSVEEDEQTIPAFLQVEEKEPVEEPVEVESEETPVVESTEPVTEPVAEEFIDESVETLQEAADLEVPVVPVKEELELISVVWATAPAGIVIEEEPAQDKPATEPEVVQEDEVPVETKAEAAEEPAEEVCPSKGEEAKVESGTETEEKPEEEPEHKLTFDDIFRDDDEDDEEKEKGGCLKVIAILLIILVILELGILGVQYFAPDSQAGAYIDKAYNYVMTLIQGNDDAPEQDEVSGPSEVQQIISKQMAKNENIVSVVENNQLHFEEGETYGYDEFADTYAFQNSPWYDNEEGESISFGDEIIGILIQYYSALSDRMNDVNKDVFDFVDDTSAFYEEIEAIEGQDDLQYVINNLEIGEIRTGAKGFYVLTRVTTVDSKNTEGETEKQVVYLEPNTSKNEMKIIEIQKI